MKNAIIGVALWQASFVLDRNITSVWIFVPINVLVACAIGTFCAFAWDKKTVEDRGDMWKLAIACFFMGAAFTGIVNAVADHWIDGLYMSDPLQSAIGAVVSYITKSFLPWLKTTVETGSWTKYIPFLKKND